MPLNLDLPGDGASIPSVDDAVDDVPIPVSSGTTEGQRYLRLEVPGYDGGAGPSPLSYIQLGAARSDGTLMQRGDDLLEALELNEATDHFFRDDYRIANGWHDPAAVYVRDDGETSETATNNPAAFVAKLTGELLTRGGYRDHTDGNRISTTRGDRIEVIGGNYKLVVLGRRWQRKDDEGHFEQNGWEPSAWEASGGIIMDLSNTGLEEGVNVKFQGTAERWRTVSETLSGNKIEIFEGSRYDTFKGREIVEIIGGEGLLPTQSGEETQGLDPEEGWVVDEGTEPLTWEKPAIETYTRALSVESTTEVYEGGSSNGRVSEETWFDTSTSTTTVEGTWTSSTEADVTHGQTGTITTPVPKLKNSLFVEHDLNVEEYFGLKVEMTAGAEAHGHTGKGFELQIGASVEAELAATVEASLNCFTFDVNLSQTTSLELGAKVAASLGLKVEVTAQHNHISVTGARAHLFELEGKETEDVLRAFHASNVLTKFWL
jgi:hypothetical protein